MLSVANVSTLLGGTGACAFDCVMALPTWDHKIAFLGGPASNIPAISESAGCEVLYGEHLIRPTVEQWKPDIVLWHNTTRLQHMPDVPSAGMAWVYYLHSQMGHVAKCQDRCSVVLSVSDYLSCAVGLPASSVLHQPVDSPLWMGERGSSGMIKVGRICTPQRHKWQAYLPAFYSALSRVSRNLWFEFVGCPRAMQADLTASCDGRATFHDASREARSLLHTWDIMLYSGGPETYGRTVCEAQQAGCVPVVDNRGGFIEQIESGRDGFLCGSVSEFSEAIRALCDADRLSRVSSAAIQSGSERGSLRAWGDEFKKRLRIKKDARNIPGA